MLKSEIGNHAGSIWGHLAENGKLSIREIGQLINCKDATIHLALGWLSRENKILFTDNGGGQICVELNHSASDNYY